MTVRGCEGVRPTQARWTQAHAPLPPLVWKKPISYPQGPNHHCYPPHYCKTPSCCLGSWQGQGGMKGAGTGISWSRGFLQGTCPRPHSWFQAKLRTSALESRADPGPVLL